MDGMFSFNFFRPAACAAVLFTLFSSATLAAALDDVKAVPHLDSAGQEGYRDFLNFDHHRAFAIAPGGAWSWKGGEASAEIASRNALQTCQTDSGHTCILYALDDKVVFDTQAWTRLWGPYLNRAQASRARTGLNRGERFYNLAFKNADGKPMKLSELRGKVVVLHFWGSWCPSCRREMPDMQQLHQALGTAKDIEMILLQVREGFAVSRQWAQQQHVSLPLFDSGVTSKERDALTLADGKKLNDRHIAPVFPTTFILDKHGVVVFSHIGTSTQWPEYLPLLRDVAARSGR